MSFPKLTFPMTVDFCSAGYWINDQGPFKYGTATTAFFIGEEIGSAANDGIPLLRELEQQLQTFGSHLKPFFVDAGAIHGGWTTNGEGL